MTTDALVQILAGHPFTAGFRPDHLRRLAGLCAETSFPRGELVFHEDDFSSLFYLLLEGSVALEAVAAGRAVRVATLYRGDALGWSSLVDAGGKQFQARALEETHTLAFDGTRLRHACEEDFAFGYAFMRAVVGVMVSRVHATRLQLEEAYTPVAGNGC